MQKIHETKICPNCSQIFPIFEEDLNYYKKINFPSPTHYPNCRQQRRYATRNERHLHKRKCDLCKTAMLSMYSPDKPFPVFCPDCWWSDRWDGTSYGKEFDFSKPFFVQFKELQKNIPRIGLYIVNSENCSYCNFVGDCKNCYLVYGSVYSEDCMYGSPYYSKNCTDSLVIRECELCYECLDCRRLYNCIYCQDSYNSDHLIFCYDLQGCSECIACAGLRNKKYHVENKAYSKKNYEKIKAQIDTKNSKHLEALKEKLKAIKLTIPHHYMPSKNVHNVSGSHIYNCKNTQNSFYVDRCEDCAYCMQVVDLKDCHDNNYTEENELCYEYLGMYGAKNTYFSTFSRHSYEVFYSEYSISAKYLFGCCGIKGKNHCILNKQYSKEKYEKLIPGIIEHMKKFNEWGEFFPISHSPFYYNETVAQEYFPITKEHALKKGYKWKDGNNAGTDRDLSLQDGNHRDIKSCSSCKKYFKLIPHEIKFYKEQKLPIPQNCPDCRHKHRLSLRNPNYLYKRKCNKCDIEISTTYQPNRPEKVYCEACYLKTIC